MMIGFVTKRMFFDAPKVARAVDKATRRVLGRFGAFVRTAARSSIRKRKRISRPGEPPSSHGGLLKRYILFGYDQARRSVVIGPMKLNQKVGNTPEALEHGGTSVIAYGLRRNRRQKRVKIRPRPYMGPAFEREQPKLPAMWANSVR